MKSGLQGCRLPCKLQGVEAQVLASPGLGPSAGVGTDSTSMPS